MASKASSSISQTLKRYIKKPWEVTGPCADLEYKNALPKATEYPRDQRRNRPPIRSTVLKIADVEKMMKEKTFDVNDFPKVYLTAKVEEDENAVGGGYQK
ncbi:Protein furry [Gossypium australe]|uniref:Protein furry n=1 Tax=Gossypium australe TaxID=47621 RepID=A0A5B6UCC4_9ROSI|nr:Protein furry [Gossypium australe]